QLLAETGEPLSRLRAALLAELGPLAAVIPQLAPGFAIVLGPLEPLPEVGPLETARRTARAVRRVLRAIASREHPLALFFDDLQWADRGSLGLLSEILSEERALALLVVATCREEDLGDGDAGRGSGGAERVEGSLPLQVLLEEQRAS